MNKSVKKMNSIADLMDSPIIKISMNGECN